MKPRHPILRIAIAGLALCSGVALWSAKAQVVFTSFGTQTIDFDATLNGVNNAAFAGSGFQSSPTAGQLDSDAWAVTGWSNGDLAFGGTQTTASTDYTRGTSAGGVTTGGIYGFDVDSTAGVNRSLGFQPGGSDWAPGTLTLKIQNTTGATIGSLDISYTVYVRNDQARANSFNFSHSADGSSFTAESSLNLTSTAIADTTPQFSPVSRNITVSGLSLADSGFYFLRWSGADVSGSGSRDEFALDDIAITAAGVPVPEPEAFAAVVGIAMAGFGLWRKMRRV